MNDNKDSLNENPFSSQRTWMKSHSVRWLTGLEPSSHEKDETLKAVTVTVSHVSHSTQNKWQKWRKDVLRHTQTFIFVVMDAIVRIYEDDLIATRNVTAIP